jgi:signal peptidase I
VKSSSVSVLATVALILAVRWWVTEPFFVQGESMMSSLHDGDRVLVERASYWFGTPARGDIVVLASPDTESLDLIKRVVAVAGETISISNCAVSVDGMELDERYLERTGWGASCGPVQEPLVVPDGTVYVLGDNRPRSSDSRFFGPVPVESIAGRAVAVIWPPKNWGLPGS